MYVPGAPTAGRVGDGAQLPGGGSVAPDFYPNWRAALNIAKAGTQRAAIDAIGDSTTAGDWAGTTAGAWANGARQGSYPYQLAGLFVSNLSMQNAGLNVFGDAGGGGITAAYGAAGSGAENDYNPDLYTGGSGTDWAVNASSVKSLGGTVFLNGSGGTSFGYVSSYGFDTADFYWAGNNSGTTATALALSAGGQTTTVNTGAQTAAGIYKTNVSVPGTAAAVTAKGGTSAAKAYLVGIDARVAANKKAVAVLNYGWGGSQASQWCETTDAFSALSALSLTSGKLGIINFGLNEMQNNVSFSTAQPYLQQLISAIKAKGADVLLVAPNQMDPTQGSMTSAATQAAWASGMQALAAANGCDFLDIKSLPQFSSYAAANSAGLMGNSVHPNRAGYGVIAQAIFNRISNP